jgi:hypothetical protein
MPETKDRDMSEFIEYDIDVDKIKYADKVREKARQKRLQAEKTKVV